MKEVNYPSYGNGKTIFKIKSFRQAFLKIISTLAIALPGSVFASTSGDVNGDGSVTTSDVELLDQIVLGYSSPTALSDVNGDGKTDVLDIIYLKNMLSGSTNDPTATSAPVAVKIESVDKTTHTMEVRLDGSCTVKGCQIDFSGVKIIGIESSCVGAEAKFRESRLLVYSETALPTQNAVLVRVRYSALGTEACIDQRTVSGAKAEMIPTATSPAGDICKDVSPIGSGTGNIGVSINLDKAPPHSSAMFDVTSTDKGILIPRMTSSQRLAISNPAQSLLVYDLDVMAYYYYCSHGWVKISSGDSGWGIEGNNGTNSSQNFIGTTDAQDLVFRTNGKEWMRILSGGNIGMGTDQPVEKLHVIGTTKADIFRLGDTGGNGVYWDFQEESNNDFSIKYGTYGEYLRIKYDNGNIGIGNSNPGQKLVVSGNIYNTGEIYSDGQRNKIRFHYDNLSELPDATQFHGMFAHVHDQSSAYFAHVGNWLRIINEDANGNAGIGTISPTSKLHIKGGAGTSYLLVESPTIKNFEIKSDGRIQAGMNEDAQSRIFASDEGTYANTIKASGVGNTNAIYGLGQGSVTGILGESDLGSGIIGKTNSGIGGYFQSNSGKTILIENSSNGNALIIPATKGSAGFGLDNPQAKVHIIDPDGLKQLILQNPGTPSGRFTPNSPQGTIAWDNDYLYIKTTTEWKRIKLNDMPNNN